MNLIRSDTVGNDLYLLLGTVPPFDSGKCLTINEYKTIFGIVPNKSIYPHTKQTK